MERKTYWLKVGYRNITVFVLKHLQGKRQINNSHIPVRWSAIDQGRHVAAKLHKRYGASFQNLLFQSGTDTRSVWPSLLPPPRYHHFFLLPVCTSHPQEDWWIRKVVPSTEWETKERLSEPEWHTQMETSAGVRVSLPDRVTLLMLVDSVSGCAGAQTVLCRNKKKNKKQQQQKSG